MPLGEGEEEGEWRLGEGEPRSEAVGVEVIAPPPPPPPSEGGEGVAPLPDDALAQGVGGGEAVAAIGGEEGEALEVGVEAPLPPPPALKGVGVAPLPGKA